MRTRSITNPEPPYDVIIFTCTLKELTQDFEDASKQLVDLMKDQEGFYGVETLINEEGFASSIFYWRNLEDINVWREINDFMNAKDGEKMKWFHHYKMRVGRIMREFEVNDPDWQEANG